MLCATIPIVFTQVRAAALDALDRTITGALNPDNLHVPDKFTAPLPPLEDGLSPATLAAVAGLSTATPGAAHLPSPSASAGAAGSLPASTLFPSSPPSASFAGSAATPQLMSGRSSREISPQAGPGYMGGYFPVPASPVSPIVAAAFAKEPQRRLSIGGNPLPPRPATPPQQIPVPGPCRAPEASMHTSFSPFAGFSGASAAAIASSLPPLTPHGAVLAPISAPMPTTALAAAALGGATGPAPPSGTAVAAANAANGPGAGASATAIRGVQQAAQQEDVQHMLLVALDSLYRRAWVLDCLLPAMGHTDCDIC